MTTCKKTFTKNRELCKNTYLRYGQFVDVNVSMDEAGHHWTQVGKHCDGGEKKDKSLPVLVSVHWVRGSRYL